MKVGVSHSLGRGPELGGLGANGQGGTPWPPLLPPTRASGTQTPGNLLSVDINCVMSHKVSMSQLKY